MTREEMRFEAALRESLQLAVSRSRPETHTMEKVVAIGVQFADALLAELDRSDSRMDPVDVGMTGDTISKGQLAELRRAKAAMETLESNGHSVSHIGEWWAAWDDKRMDGAYAPTLLALAEKIRGEAK